MDKARAQSILARIDEILRWEQRLDQQKDQKFAELGKHLCEVRDQRYWRVRYKSFEEFLEAKFPDSRRKAYYLMSIHDNLRQIPTEEIEVLGWSKALELAKVARNQGRNFSSATWLHRVPKSARNRSSRKKFTSTLPAKIMSLMRWFISSSSTVSCPSWKGRCTSLRAWRGRNALGGTVWN